MTSNDTKSKIKHTMTDSIYITNNESNETTSISTLPNEMIT